MSEGREVWNEVGATEEGVRDRTELLETEDENVWRWTSWRQGREEVRGEDGGIDGNAPTIVRQRVCGESRHSLQAR